MRGLVREVKRRASVASRGKDLAANVRARIYWLKKRGYRVAYLEILNRPVYDVDAIQGALQCFARFIYKLPIERQIQVIRLLVNRVLLFKDRIRVELHELPIPDLQRALDVKTGGPPRKVQIPTTSKGGGQKTTTERTAVVEVGGNWRPSLCNR
ncbi:MAG: hypothetical protein HY927_04915 [Elusimicrobia bacterium]|nr:hypothetical protein [Elusimicrobiota bacterium]